MRPFGRAFETACEVPFRYVTVGRTDAERLRMVQAIHTAIYVVMALSTFVLLYAGVTGSTGPLVHAALALLAIEVVVFAGNGFACPLTAIAVTYGAESGRVGDTFLPERVTRYTFRFFGSVMFVGLALISARALDLIN